jgi:hypothetical protein
VTHEGFFQSYERASRGSMDEWGDGRTEGRSQEHSSREKRHGGVNRRVQVRRWLSESHDHPCN